MNKKLSSIAPIRRRFITFVSLWTLAAICWTPVASGDDGKGNPIAPVRELSEVVGDYTRPISFGISYGLRLGADGQFRCEWRGCIGVERTIEGTFDVVDGVVVLEYDGESSTFVGGRRFIPIRWGERLYLQPEKTIRRFRDALLHSGDTERVPAECYLRDGDHRSAATGVPVAPAPWSSQFETLVPVEVTAHVTYAWASGPAGELQYHVALDTGTAGGIRKGFTMWFAPNSQTIGHGRMSVRIDEIDENTATGWLILPSYDALTRHPQFHIGNTLRILTLVEGVEVKTDR